MKVCHIYYRLVRLESVRYMRSYAFLLAVGLIVFLAYLAVPDASAGYQVFYIAGVRGEYNSAWLGGMGTMLSTLFVWLFGFYMLRSQISKDARYKIAPLIASSSISKFRYVCSKVLSHFVILLAIHLILMLSFLVMQLIRGEAAHLDIWAYLAPTLYITLPSFATLAALTVLFDSISWLKGTIGNILFFMLWLLLSVMAIEQPNSLMDVFGIDVIRASMVEAAGQTYPHILQGSEGGSFGYYPLQGPDQTFEWNGVDWSIQQLYPRFFWIMVALFLSMVAASTLRISQKTKINHRPKKHPSVVVHTTREIAAASWTPIVRKGRINLTKMIQFELLYIVKSMSIWWHLLAVGWIIFCLAAPISIVTAWLPLVMLWPLAVWSQLTVKEKEFGVAELLKASGSSIYPLVAAWIAGVMLSIVLSSGVLIRFSGEMELLLSWLVACFFIPTLAAVLGIWSGTRKMFEVIYLIWWYMGPVNGLPYVDFLGLSTPMPTLYSVLTIVLLMTTVPFVVKRGR